MIFYRDPDAPDIVTIQQPVEFEKLLDIYCALKPMHVLEIGSQDGGTLYQWLKHAPDGAIVVNVDILSNQPRNKAARLQAIWQSWVRPGITLKTYIGNSHDVGTYWQVFHWLPEIDFAFIDGDHSYDGAKQDWEWYGPLVRAGGMIAFHDLICPGPPQQYIKVGDVFKEIQMAGYHTEILFSEPHQTWGGIGIVHI